jgi:hypothetical protein
LPLARWANNKNKKLNFWEKLYFFKLNWGIVYSLCINLV